MSDAVVAPHATPRFGRKREAILAAATEILNRRGVKGMTLALVAERVGLITTSVTYYFKKKEDLACACFLAGIARLEALVGAAAAAPTVNERLWALIDAYLSLRRAIRAGEAPPIPVFSDIRALEPEQHRPQVAAAYAGLFLKVRALFRGAGAGGLDGRTATAWAQMLL
jgi:AcrR family transcriptional regulator